MNGLCGPGLVVREVVPAERGFDARFSARSRRYRYTVVNRPVADPFRWPPRGTWPSRWTWPPCAWPPTRSSASTTSRPSVAGPGRGRRQSGAGRAGSAPSLVRRVLDAGWDEVDDGVLHFEVEATSFCHQMVRSMVGTMVEAGRGGAGRATWRGSSGPVPGGGRRSGSGVAEACGKCATDGGVDPMSSLDPTAPRPGAAVTPR